MSFCTAINCMDGRVQLPVINYLKEQFGIDYVDSITEAGPVHIFAAVADLAILNSIFTRINISIQKHNSNTIAICAHADCAGNPVNDEIQNQQLERATIFLQESYPNVNVIALWIDETWQVHQLEQ